MIKQLLCTLSFVLFIANGLSAQELTTWSLEKCITHAHENNITVKRQALDTQLQENQLKQSKLNRYPDLNASIDGAYNFGRTWVEQEGTNIQNNNSSLQPQLNSSVPIYQGMKITNTIKRNEFNLMAAVESANETKNDIALRITSQYMQILFDKELLVVAKDQYGSSMLQVERTQKLVDAGSVAKGNLLEIKSQAAKEALSVTQQENNLALSLLSLAQLLDLENPVGFEIEIPAIPELQGFEADRPASIYGTAVDIMPEIKGAEYALNSSEYDLKIAKAGFQPTLGFGAGLDSRATWLLDDPDGLNRSLSDQIKDSRRAYVGLSLRIPIFNKLQARTNVSNAKLDVLDAKYRLDSEKLALRKEIQQAYADALAAYKKYLSSVEAVESFKESFRYTEQKYNVGLVNLVEYNVSKTDYTRAQSNLLQSKYEYVLRAKILDFYNGIPITL